MSANLRFETGETNLLAATAARAKYNEIALLKQQAKADIEIYKVQLNKLLNIDDTAAFRIDRISRTWNFCTSTFRMEYRYLLRSWRT